MSSSVAFESGNRPNPMMARVLFVCLGNICRSPTAEGVFRARARAGGAGAHVVVDSAGIGDVAGRVATGSPGDPGGATLAATTSRLLRARQIDGRGFRPLRLDPARWIRSNLRGAGGRCAAGHRGDISGFADLAPEAGLREVPDPYYGVQDGFERVLDLVEQASDALIVRVARGLGRAAQRVPAASAPRDDRLRKMKAGPRPAFTSVRRRAGQDARRRRVVLRLDQLQRLVGDRDLRRPHATRSAGTDRDSDPHRRRNRVSTSSSPIPAAVTAIPAEARGSGVTPATTRGAGAGRAFDRHLGCGVAQRPEHRFDCRRSDGLRGSADSTGASCRPAGTSDIFARLGDGGRASPGRRFAGRRRGQWSRLPGPRLPATGCAGADRLDCHDDGDRDDRGLRRPWRRRFGFPRAMPGLRRLDRGQAASAGTGVAGGALEEDVARVVRVVRVAVGPARGSRGSRGGRGSRCG